MGPESNFGALLEGTRKGEDPEKQSKWILLYPALFFARRIALIASVLLIVDYLWVQIAIQFAFSTTMIIYLMHVWPLETATANKMEVFNECTIILLHYGLMMFTDYVPEAETRHYIGWYYIAVSLGNILVHIFFLILDSSKRTWSWCRQKYIKSRRGRGIEKRRARKPKQNSLARPTKHPKIWSHRGSAIQKSHLLKRQIEHASELARAKRRSRSVEHSQKPFNEERPRSLDKVERCKNLLNAD